MHCKHNKWETVWPLVLWLPYLLIMTEHREVSPQMGGRAQHWTAGLWDDGRGQGEQHHSAGQHDGPHGGNTRWFEYFLFVDWGLCWYAGSLIFNILRWMVSLVCWVLVVLCSYYTIHRQIPTNHQWPTCPTLGYPGLYCSSVQWLYSNQHHCTLF